MGPVQREPVGCSFAHRARAACASGISLSSDSMSAAQCFDHRNGPVLPSSYHTHVARTRLAVGRSMNRLRSFVTGRTRGR